MRRRIAAPEQCHHPPPALRQGMPSAGRTGAPSLPLPHAEGCCSADRSQRLSMHLGSSRLQPASAHDDKM